MNTLSVHAALVGSIGPLAALGHMLAHPFIRNAFVAGTAIAACSGLVGYFVVLRGQVFTGDALSHVAFTGALAALAFGIDARVGLFVATIGVALLLGLLGPRGRADDVVIGSVFAWVLGLGVLFLSIFTTSAATGNSAAGTNILFGSIFGLSHGQTVTAVVVAALVVVALLAMARPLLFASVDEAVAAARGVPVTALGFAFLVLVGATAAEATQAVGALLLLGLLAAPAATATHLTSRPYRALALSAAIAVGSIWIGLTISYVAPALPPSFAILAVATATYASTLAWVHFNPSIGRRRQDDRPTSAPVPADRR
jgi:zinc/manganese transport system permease protein